MPKALLWERRASMIIKEMKNRILDESLRVYRPEGSWTSLRPAFAGMTNSGIIVERIDLKAKREFLKLEFSNTKMKPLLFDELTHSARKALDTR